MFSVDRFMASRPNRNTVREFVIDRVDAHAAEIVRVTAEEFGVSRQAAHKWIRRMVEDGLVASAGATNARRYRLRDLFNERKFVEISPELHEDAIWKQFAPQLAPNQANSWLVG